MGRPLGQEERLPSHLLAEPVYAHPPLGRLRRPRRRPKHRPGRCPLRRAEALGGDARLRCGRRPRESPSFSLQLTRRRTPTRGTTGFRWDQSAISKTLVITKEMNDNVLWASWVDQVVPAAGEVMVAKGRRGGKKWDAPFRVPGTRPSGTTTSRRSSPSERRSACCGRIRRRRRKSVPLRHPPDQARSSNSSLERPYLHRRRMVNDHISLKSWKRACVCGGEGCEPGHQH